MLNCSSIKLNSSNTVLFPNGTLWIPLYATGYSRADYFMNGSNVVLCTKFSSDYSKREIIAKWSYVLSPLQILTYVGCSVSVLSLLVLLVVYSLFDDLINLSFAMLFYHMFLFVAGLRNIQALCTGIAIILHYFLLCSFAWMSVMAFDVAKTFVFQGKKLYSLTRCKLNADWKPTCLALNTSHLFSTHSGFSKEFFNVRSTQNMFL